MQTKIKRIGDYVPVLLPPVQDAEQQDTNLEPQYVKIRSGNVATLYIDSQKPFFQLEPNNMQISSNISFNAQPQNLIRNINRLAVSKFELFWQPANVNPNNSSYTWHLFDGSTTYTFSHVLTTGNYTLNQLMTIIVGEMTSDATGSGFSGNFTVVFDSNGFLSTINDNIPGTTFWFDQSCLLVKQGAPLLAIPFMEPGAGVTSLLVGPSRMLYSRYVDVVSDDMAAYSKNLNRSINLIGQNIILRQSLINPKSNWSYETDIINLVWMNWSYLAPAPTLRFRMYDEFGNLFFFLPQNVSGISTPTLNWTMEIMLEG